MLELAPCHARELVKPNIVGELHQVHPFRALELPQSEKSDGQYPIVKTGDMRIRRDK